MIDRRSSFHFLSIKSSWAEAAAAAGLFNIVVSTFAGMSSTAPRRQREWNAKWEEEPFTSRSSRRMDLLCGQTNETVEKSQKWYPAAVCLPRD